MEGLDQSAKVRVRSKAAAAAAVVTAHRDEWALNKEVSVLASSRVSFIHRVRMEGETGSWIQDGGSNDVI